MSTYKNIIGFLVFSIALHVSSLSNWAYALDLAGNNSNSEDSSAKSYFDDNLTYGDGTVVHSTGTVLELTQLSKRVFAAVLDDSTKSLSCSSGTVVRYKQKTVMLLTNPYADCTITYNTERLYQPLDLKPILSCKADRAFDRSLGNAKNLLVSNTRLSKTATDAKRKAFVSIWNGLYPTYSAYLSECKKSSKLSIKVVAAEKMLKRLNRQN